MGELNARSVILSLAPFALLCALAFAHGAELQSGRADPLSVAAIKSCLTNVSAAECLDQLFRDALKSHSTAELLQFLRHAEAEDPDIRRDCHPVVHAVGRETFRIKGNIHDSFAACDPTCHSGCYHGSVERFLRGDEVYSQIEKHPSAAELKQKAALACDPNIPLRFRFQCLHGLGHALLFFSRYRLEASLEACDALPDDWSRHSCYGGVFMENVFNVTPESRDLSPTDYHYPCNKVAEKYRSECYVMQTSRMAEMGLSPEEIFRQCEKAGPYQQACVRSLGRDLSNFVRAGEFQSTAQKCEIVSGERRAACVQGAVYALLDNTWDGRYALPFCAALSEEQDRASCFKTSARYLLETFEISRVDIARDCTTYLKQPEPCVEALSR